MPGTDALAAAFAKGRGANRALLMPFLVCGYPDDDTFVDIAKAAGAAGADMLEIGIPFSDPIMDGPVIQEAAFSVLARSPRTRDMIALAGQAADAAGVPAVAMTYYNLAFRAGLDAFASSLGTAGLSGAILPDLSVEEAGEWRKACASAGVASVFIAAVTSTDDRLKAIGDVSEGFVYAASMLGVTGVRSEMSSRAQDLVVRIRAATELPVAVGIGVSTAAHAAEVASYADGVIVGSALVQRVGEARKPAKEAGAFIEELRAGIDEAAR
ncbi:MAG: tryptophan synthase subunit alpha [Actinomycetota bacterium]